MLNYLDLAAKKREGSPDFAAVLHPGSAEKPRKRRKNKKPRAKKLTKSKKQRSIAKSATGRHGFKRRTVSTKRAKKRAPAKEPTHMARKKRSAAQRRATAKMIRAAKRARRGSAAPKRKRRRARRARETSVAMIVAPKRRKRRRKSSSPVVRRRRRRSRGGRSHAKSVRAGRKAARTKARRRSKYIRIKPRARSRKGRIRRRRYIAFKEEAPKRRRRRSRRARRNPTKRGYWRRHHVRRSSRARAHYSREKYAMENPLNGGELLVSLLTGVLGFAAEDFVDRLLATHALTDKGVLGSDGKTTYADSPATTGSYAGLYNAAAVLAPMDLKRWGVGALMTFGPIGLAHVVKSNMGRSALQMAGFGAGMRWLGKGVQDLAARFLGRTAVGARLLDGEARAAALKAGGDLSLFPAAGLGRPRMFGCGQCNPCQTGVGSCCGGSTVSVAELPQVAPPPPPPPVSMQQQMQQSYPLPPQAQFPNYPRTPVAHAEIPSVPPAITRVPTSSTMLPNGGSLPTTSFVGASGVPKKWQHHYDNGGE
jgi:hypothetical protein